MKALKPGSNMTRTINLTVKVDNTMKKIEKHLGQAYSLWQDIEQQIGMRNEGIDEATIPQGKTAFTKKDMPNKKDMAKLQKLRKMLDKEKKPRKEGVDEDAQINEAFSKWTITVVKPINKLKKGDKVTVSARGTAEALKKAAKAFKDPNLNHVPSSHFDIKKLKGFFEDAPANAVAGGGVDMTPGKKANMNKKPLKRFKEFTKG